MAGDLTGKTALVTASTQGIGRASALLLAQAGASLVVNGRSQEAVDRAVSAIADEGGRATGVVADMSDAAGCAAVIDAVPAPDIFVHNVAFIGWSDFLDADDDVWEEAFETNVMAGVRLARHYLPAMMGKGWGRMVFISSESARNIQPDLVAYGATKLALHALSRGVAKRARGTGVTANVVLPGPTLSDGAQAMLEPMAQSVGSTVEEAGAAFVREHRPSSLLGRMATVEEVAAMVAYACSPQASATTGCVLRVDGGVVDDIS